MKSLGKMSRSTAKVLIASIRRIDKQCYTHTNFNCSNGEIILIQYNDEMFERLCHLRDLQQFDEILVEVKKYMTWDPREAMRLLETITAAPTEKAAQSLIRLKHQTQLIIMETLTRSS